MPKITLPAGSSVAERALGMASSDCLRMETACGKKPLARFGQLDAPARPVKQAGANFVFELGCLMAQGGLCNKDPVGRFGERAALGNGNEIPQLTKFHGVVCWQEMDFFLAACRAQVLKIWSAFFLPKKQALFSCFLSF
jgi:hypothetical protein